MGEVQIANVLVATERGPVVVHALYYQLIFELGIVIIRDQDYHHLTLLAGSQEEDLVTAVEH